MVSFVRVAAAAGSLAAVVLASSGAVGQTYYYYQPSHAQPYVRHHYQPYGYYQQPYGYVDPRIARKQAQQRRRFIEKYGYVQPQPHVYGGGWGHHPGYNPYPYGRFRQQPQPAPVENYGVSRGGEW
jgi:hypothetical protein